ncbi:MAG: hypothetical protein LBL75_01320 [Rickettsiales bacterium]|jgi:hypothetical protein|nr:hypothetical protein [Rickettsiales bacterium]
MSDKKKKPFPLKPILLWTGWYFVISYLIFLLMFNFNILHLSDWAILPNIGFHGFGGLIFGICVLSFIPIYIGGFMVIKKNGRGFFTPTPKEKAVYTPEIIQHKNDLPPIDFPKNMPEEMRFPYTRLKRGGLSSVAIECNVLPTPNDGAVISADCTPEAPIQMDSDIALPDDFDIADKTSNAPVFRELNWGESKDDNSDKNDTKSEQTDEIAIELRGDKKFAIISHDDPDFWIADENEWFAGGKQKPSPIKFVMARAESENATPVLLLKTKNIMDLESLQKKWESDGILVINDLDELK